MCFEFELIVFGGIGSSVDAHFSRIVAKRSASAGCSFEMSSASKVSERL